MSTTSEITVCNRCRMPYVVTGVPHICFPPLTKLAAYECPDPKCPCHVWSRIEKDNKMDDCADVQAPRCTCPIWVGFDGGRADLARKVLETVSTLSIDEQYSPHYRNGFWKGVNDLEVALRDLFKQEGIDVSD